MIIYGLKNCDTCRKALKSLDGATLHDVRADGFPGDLLDRAATEFGSDLLNTRSTTWRGLDNQERAGDMATLLRKYPALMKRPLIEADNRLYLGWTEATRQALGLG